VGDPLLTIRKVVPVPKVLLQPSPAELKLYRSDSSTISWTTAEELGNYSCGTMIKIFNCRKKYFAIGNLDIIVLMTAFIPY
jgi:hypothetical protein